MFWRVINYSQSIEIVHASTPFKDYYLKDVIGGVSEDHQNTLTQNEGVYTEPETKEDMLTQHAKPGIGCTDS